MEFLHLLFLLLLGVSYSTALLSVEVQLVSYNNPTSRLCDGDVCETLFPTCDNMFDFCLRRQGSTSCLATLTTEDVEDDSMAFTSSVISELEITNPIRFSSISTSALLELYVVVSDDDFDPFPEHVDDITIPLTADLKANSEYGPSTIYYGICGRSQLEVRVRIISQCSPNMYGPSCSVECEEVAEQRLCNYLGQATCLGNFDGTNCDSCTGNFEGAGCDMCLTNYYPDNVCNINCVPMNNELGHYTCDSSGGKVCLSNYYPATICITYCEPKNSAEGHFNCDSNGNKVCLDGYTDTSTDCVTCSGHFQEPNCALCDDNFYPQATCDTFCEGRDDELGHYVCDSGGNKVCLSGYVDPSTDCRMCAGNFKEPDCVQCDDHFEGDDCNTCIENYYPTRTCDVFCEPRDDELGHYTCNSLGSKVCLPGYVNPDTSCVTCQGNFNEPDCIECDVNFEGDDCVTCQANYFPRDNCSIYCTPRDGSEGHYTCNSVTGQRECLEGYRNPSTNCITPVEENEGFVGSIGFYAVIGGGVVFLVVVLCIVFCIVLKTRKRTSPSTGNEGRTRQMNQSKPETLPMATNPYYTTQHSEQPMDKPPPYTEAAPSAPSFLY